MNRTVELLEEKNGYLEKFMGLNRDWLDRLMRGDFGDLENFRENRENILNITKHIDALVEAQCHNVETEDVDYAVRVQIHELLERKDSLVKAILAQDLDIMNIIEGAKSQIIRDLKEVQKGRKISSYKNQPRKDVLDEEV